MRVVDIGGSGLVASKFVATPGADGNEAVTPSPDSGVNILAGEGLADVLEGAWVVVDVTNSPSFDVAVLEFFEISVAYFGDVEHSFRLMPNARFDQRDVVVDERCQAQVKLPERQSWAR